MSAKPIPSESDYPGTVFFGVYRGNKTGVRATFAQLMKEINGYKSPVWEAFNNKAHAEQFAKTGSVPSGVSPVQPGVHNTPGNRRTSGHSGSSSGGRFANPLSRAGATSNSTATLGASKSMSALASATAPAPKLAPTNSVPAFNRSPTRAGPPSTASVTETVRSMSTLSGSSRGHPVSATTSSSSIGSSSFSGTTSASTANTNPGLVDEEEIKVWTDGACSGNGKLGARAAYGVYFGEGDPRNEANRVPGMQTNNRGELLGVIRALEIVDESVPSLIIYTDSEYTQKCKDWLPGWVSRGGRNSSNKPAANYAMIRYMVALMDRRGDRLQVLYVKGHSDNVGNNAADALAVRASKSISKIPEEVDWDAKRITLERRPASPNSGKPLFKTMSPSDVTSVPPRTQIAKGSIARTLENARILAVEPDSEDEYNDFDDDDFLGIDESSLPQPVVPPPTAVTQPNQGKRAREPADDEEEIEDSETERKAVKKAGKKRRVKCPNCKNEFPI